MYVQNLKIQLTYTASDTREIKMVHFSKVRRKKVTFFNKRKTKIILLFWSLHPSLPPLCSNTGQSKLIWAILHKHSKFTNISTSSYKTRQMMVKQSRQPPVLNLMVKHRKIYTYIFYACWHRYKAQATLVLQWKAKITQKSQTFEYEKYQLLMATALWTQ